MDTFNLLESRVLLSGNSFPFLTHLAVIAIIKVPNSPVTLSMINHSSLHAVGLGPQRRESARNLVPPNGPLPPKTQCLSDPIR